MKKAGIFLIFGLYGAIVTSFGAYQYHNYQKSFDKIIPYSHTMETQPTETILETEVLTIQANFETIAENLTSPPTETNSMTEPEQIPQTDPIPTSAGVSETPSISEAVTEPPELVQNEQPETEWTVTYPLNLNTATFEELCTLPEIGEALAQAILNYRDEIGGFVNREQLMEISGIGEHRYSAIAPLLMIENEQPIEQPQPETVPDPIPTEPPAPEPPQAYEPPENLYINLNTATKEQLMQLPDCTEGIAETIIELREVHIHTFSNPLEILHIEAISKDYKISAELYYSWEQYLFVDDSGGKQLYLYSQPEPE